MKIIEKEFDSYKEMTKYLSMVENVHEYRARWNNGVWMLTIVKIVKHSEQQIQSEEDTDMNLLEKVGITLAGCSVAWFGIGMTWGMITENMTITWSAIIPMIIFLSVAMIFEEKLIGGTSSYSGSYDKSNRNSGSYSCSCDD